MSDVSGPAFFSDTGRPIPQVTLSSKDFWSSGADGVLRVARCRQCATWAHPRPVRCHRCGSDDIEMAATSGRATVVGYTVNHQQWLASMPPPYVIAIVALAEDPSVRLTTNIVGCDPDAVAIDAAVRVVFEHVDTEVWLPLFELDTNAPAMAAVVDPNDGYGRFLRSPRSVAKFENKVALTGVGQSRVGRRLMVDPVALTVQACLAAIDDAGLDLEQIDGLATYPGPLANGMSEGGVIAVEEALRIHPVWVNGGADLPGQNGSIIAAMLAVAAGLCRHVLCFRTVWESSYAAMVRHGQWTPEHARATGMFEFRAPFGAMSAANWIGCHASAYLQRYGASREALGWIAVTERDNAADNPDAVYRDPLRLDDYLGARMVSTPLGLYDCDVPVDGAVAVIVSAAETVADLDCTPVYVEAVGTQIMERLSWDQGTLGHLPQSLGPAKHLWTRTSLRPYDVDVALLYDGFTFNALSWLEGLGFCGFGEAPAFIDGGRGIAVDGRLPLNPHGGQLSAGRTHGYGFVREAILQLRRQARGRQVHSPRVAVVTAGGGVPSGAMLLRSL